MTETADAARTDRDFSDAFATIDAAPGDIGRLDGIVSRPARDERVTLESAQLDRRDGLVGDDWIRRGSKSTPDGAADPRSQVTLISVRLLAAIEPDRARWPLSGDQLHVDFDLSVDALPPGARLAIGDAILEVTDKPHTGCAKFSARFGIDALRWISTPEGRGRRLRGVNTNVVRSGTVRVDDPIHRLDDADGRQ